MLHLNRIKALEHLSYGVFGLSSVLEELIVYVFDRLDVVGECLNIALTLILVVILHLIATHDPLDLLHDFVDVKSDRNCQGHFVRVVNAHSKKTLHGLKLSFVSFSDRKPTFLIDELYDSTWGVFMLAIYRPNQEIADLGSGALVINFILEFSLFGSVVRYVDLSGLKHLARET